MDCDIPEVGPGIISYATRFARYGVMWAGGYMVAKGWIDNDVVEAAAAIAASAAPIVVGTIIGRINRRKLKTAVAVAKENTNSEA